MNGEGEARKRLLAYAMLGASVNSTPCACDAATRLTEVREFAEGLIAYEDTHADGAAVSIAALIRAIADDVLAILNGPA